MHNCKCVRTCSHKVLQYETTRIRLGKNHKSVMTAIDESHYGLYSCAFLNNKLHIGLSASIVRLFLNFACLFVCLLFRRLLDSRFLNKVIAPVLQHCTPGQSPGPMSCNNQGWQLWRLHSPSLLDRADWLNR